MAKSRPRLPLQIPPFRIEAEYAAALTRIIRRATGAFVPLVAELPALLAPDEHVDGWRLDAGKKAATKAKIAAAAKAARNAVRVDEIEQLARKFSTQTSTHQRIQLGRQVRAAIGVDPLIRDPQLEEFRKQFVAENVRLIKRIPTRLHDSVAVLVDRAVDSARPHPALGRQIERRFGISERHAKLIARDQISKFHAKLNHKRQRDLGVSRFIWRAVGDERVRDLHDDFDGEEFAYDDPPENEKGEPVLPGDDIQCRCSAEPVFD